MVADNVVVVDVVGVAVVVDDAADKDQHDVGLIVDKKVDNIADDVEQVVVADIHKTVENPSHNFADIDHSDGVDIHYEQELVVVDDIVVDNNNLHLDKLKLIAV